MALVAGSALIWSANVVSLSSPLTCKVQLLAQLLIFNSYEGTDREVSLNGFIDDGGDGVVCIGGGSGHHDVNVEPNDGVLLHRIRCSLPSGGTLLKIAAVDKRNQDNLRQH